MSCRLDRFYISKLLVDDVLACDNLPFGCSDHDAVMLKIKANTGITFGPGYWKFNNSLLQDKAFVELFTKYWVELIDGIDMDLDLWDHLKNKLRILLYITVRKKLLLNVHCNLLKHLEKSYHRLQYYEYHNPGLYIERVREIKSQIKDIQFQNYSGSKIRSRAESLDNDEKPSKVFFQQEIKRAKQKTITKIITGSSCTVSNSKDMLIEFKDFYSELYRDEGIDQDLASAFLKSIPKLRNDVSAMCEALQKKNLFWHFMIWRIISRLVRTASQKSFTPRSHLYF